jgi:hypothetical protein
MGDDRALSERLYVSPLLMPSRHSLIAGAAAMPIAATSMRPALAGDDDAELTRLAAEVKAAWKGLGHAIDVYDAAMGTPDAAEAEAAQDAAGDGLQAVIDALCDTPARTIRSLVAKARATKIGDGMFDDLRRSIVANLLALDAGAVRASDVLAGGLVLSASHQATSLPRLRPGLFRIIPALRITTDCRRGSANRIMAVAGATDVPAVSF